MTRRCVLMLLGAGVLTTSAVGQEQQLTQHLRHALDFAVSQYRQTAVLFSDSVTYPRSTTPAGTWNAVPPRDWTSGFYPGILWYLYEYTGDRTFRSDAARATNGLAALQFYGGTHDLGFMMFCSYGNALRLAPEPSTREVLLQSARTLASRYSPIVGSIKSWDWNPAWEFPVIIDNMMNLELLFWAAKNGGGSPLSELAVRHAETTSRHHFRDDGSTFHVVNFDTATGAVLLKTTHQGHAPGSAWARGQAWALYGFTMTYRETRNPLFLTTAQRAADYFLAHLPEDRVPYWDFQAPGIPDAARDASAAAIAASGLLELADLTSEPTRSVVYRKAAEAILRSLAGPGYLAEGTPSAGVLRHSTGNHPAGLEIDVSLVYGDYYFVEAALRYLRRHK